MKERVLNRLLRRRAVRENGRLIGRWMLRTANPFKNCEISSDGSLVVFWTDRELTLFTSLSLTNGDVEARPQDQWSLEREKHSIDKSLFTSFYVGRHLPGKRSSIFILARSPG
jgi:hypothetical protein